MIVSITGDGVTLDPDKAIQVRVTSPPEIGHEIRLPFAAGFIPHRALVVHVTHYAYPLDVAMPDPDYTYPLIEVRPLDA